MFLAGSPRSRAARVSQVLRAPVDPPVTAWEARPDGELLRSDSPQAFAVFYRRHLPWVLRWLGGKVRDREVAADLTGEVFAAALRGRHTFRDDASPAEPWLQSIVRNVLVDSVRRRRVEDRARRELGIATLTITDTDLERVDALIDQAQGAAPALHALGSLPATQSEAVRARVLAEEDYDAIAERLECSAAVVRQRVSRGLKTLRARLEDDA